jgi:hypothetical protein
MRAIEMSMTTRVKAFSFILNFAFVCPAFAESDGYFCSGDGYLAYDIAPGN